MFFSTILSALSLAAAASAVTVSYDTGYDDASRSMTAVSCSDGTNGLITRYGWQTQGQIPHFPLVGGSSAVAGWNSDACGQCVQLTYAGMSINVLAIDHADEGFNIAQEAMDALTNGQAVALGRGDAEAIVVDGSACGL